MSQHQSVRIDPERVRALHAALGLEGPAPAPGAPLPHFWHWTQFWDVAPQDALGPDGHPQKGMFLPDLGLPRRMWAGGALTFHAPLIVGDMAQRHSVVGAATRKTGRSGPLAFVSVTHELRGEKGPCIIERQDLVYRELPSEGDAPIAPPKAGRDEAHSKSFKVSTTDLFRYSALTFNGHRIHYDLDYARDVEGYPGLIIHGPLLAQRMVELAAELLDDLSEFSYRAVSPLFHFEGFDVCARTSEDGLDLWVRGEDGRLAMKGHAA